MRLSKNNVLFSSGLNETEMAEVIHKGYLDIIDTLKIPLLKLTDRQQTEAVFLDCIMNCFLSDEQRGLIGRLPPNSAHMHLDAVFRRFYYHKYSDPSFRQYWIAQNRVIAALLNLIFYDNSQYPKAAFGVYQGLAAYIYESHNCQRVKTSEQFLSIVLSVLCYQTSFVKEVLSNFQENLPKSFLTPPNVE
jgi:hypothetical protein